MVDLKSKIPSAAAGTLVGGVFFGLYLGLPISAILFTSFFGFLASLAVIGLVDKWLK